MLDPCYKCEEVYTEKKETEVTNENLVFPEDFPFIGFMHKEIFATRILIFDFILVKLWECKLWVFLCKFFILLRIFRKE